MKTKAILLVIAIGLIASAFFLLDSPSDDFIILTGDLMQSPAKLSKQERMMQYANYEFERARDPKTNSIPVNIKTRELAFVADNFPSQSPMVFMKQGSANPNLTWTSRGPTNIGGRTLCLAQDMENPNIIFAGSASGGLWRSIDKAASWMKVTAPDAVQSVRSIVQDTRGGRTDTWYYGTGELLSNTDRKISTETRTIGYGDGIYKSTNSGLNWEILESTTGGVTQVLNYPFQCVWRMLVDTEIADKDVVLAACYGGIMRSEDGGASWEKVLGDDDNMSFSSDIARTENGRYYAALASFTGRDGGDATGGVYQSTDGIDWEEITPGGFPDNTRMVKLAAASEGDVDILYVLTEAPFDNPEGPYGGFTSSIHTLSFGYYENQKWQWYDNSDNLPGGRYSWDLRNQFNTIGGYCMTIKTDPDDPFRVFLGGTNLYVNEGFFTDTLFTEKIGGYGVGSDWERALHPDNHDILFDTDTDEMYIANDGGVFKNKISSPDPDFWQRMNQNLTTTQFYALAIDRSAPGDEFIVGGLQDNNSQYLFPDYDGTEWEFITGGDGMTTKVGKDKKLVITSAQSGWVFVHTYVSDDSFRIFFRLGGDGKDHNFYTLYELDPDDIDYLYFVAKSKIRRISGYMKSIGETSIDFDPILEITDGFLDTTISITAIHATESPDDNLLIGTNSGQVYIISGARTDNPGMREITGINFPQGGFVSCVETDPDNPDRIIVTYSNYNLLSIFYTEDGGNSWLPVGGNLEESPDGAGAGPSVRWVKMLKYKGKETFFVGTSSGLFSAGEFAGENTQWIRQGAENIGVSLVEMIDARNSDGFIAVATFGSGVFTAYADDVSTILTDRYVPFDLRQNYPNPADNQTTIAFNLSELSNVSLKVYGQDGREVDELINTVLNIGEYEIPFDCSKLNPGTYIYVLRAGEFVASRKMTAVR